MICPKYALQNLLGSVLFERPVSSSIHSFTVMCYALPTFQPVPSQRTVQGTKGRKPSLYTGGKQQMLVGSS